MMPRRKLARTSCATFPRREWRADFGGANCERSASGRRIQFGLRFGAARKRDADSWISACATQRIRECAAGGLGGAAFGYGAGRNHDVDNGRGNERRTAAFC